MSRTAAKKKPAPPAKRKPALRVVRSEARETLADRIRRLQHARAAVQEAHTASDQANEQLHDIEAQHAELVRKYESTAPGDRISALASGRLNATKQSAGEAAYRRKAAELDAAAESLRRIQADAQAGSRSARRPPKWPSITSSAPRRTCLPKKSTSTRSRRLS